MQREIGDRSASRSILACAPPHAAPTEFKQLLQKTNSGSECKSSAIIITRSPLIATPERRIQIVKILGSPDGAIDAGDPVSRTDLRLLELGEKSEPWRRPGRRKHGVVAGRRTMRAASGPTRSSSAGARRVRFSRSVPRRSRRRHPTRIKVPPDRDASSGKRSPLVSRRDRRAEPAVSRTRQASLPRPLVPARLVRARGRKPLAHAGETDLRRAPSRRAGGAPICCFATWESAR